jgi:hypothetical protein
MLLFRIFLVLYGIDMFFVNIIPFFWVNEYISVPIAYFISVWCLMGIGLIAMRGGIDLSGRSNMLALVACAFAHILISVIWFIPSHQYRTNTLEMRDRALNLFYLISTLIALADPILLRYARASLIYCVLLGVAINVYEFFFPSTFSVVDGRSAGLYMNPNQCGAALVLGLILAMGAVPPRYRLLFVLANGLGVALTFSRAAILGYMLCVASALLNGTLRLRDSLNLRIAVPLVGLAILAYTGVKLSSSSGDNATVRKGIYERIMEFGVSKSNMDDSAQARVAAAEHSLALFSARPFTGHGTGRAREYPLDVDGPHNMYLFFLVDHGLLGAFILPAFAIASALGARGEAARIAAPFILFLLFWGLFSHNVVEERYILLAMAIMASLADKGRIEQIRGAICPA